MVATQSMIGKRYIVSMESRISSQEILQYIQDILQKTHNNISLMNYTMYCDTSFTGGNIPIGQKEVDSIQRLYDDFHNFTLRPIQDTIYDMVQQIIV